MSTTAIEKTRGRPAQRWPDGYFTTPDGARLHYIEAGAGTPVILVHGARGSAIGNWFSNGIAQRLAETNKVYALDMRGHGLSDAFGEKPFNHLAMAEDILAFLDAMGIEKAHMGGYSMGAYTLVEVMMIAPERILTCSLHGGGVYETAEWKDRVPPDKEGPAPEEAAAEEIVRRRREAKGAETGNTLPWNRTGGPPPEMQAMFRKREERIAAFDFSTIKFPVMAINGEYDRPLERTHRLWRELGDFTNLVLPGKGHLTAMMTGFIPDAYIEGFAAFVARHNPKD